MESDKLISYSPPKDYTKTCRIVIHKYIKFIGPTAYSVYSLYASLVNTKTGTAFPSLQYTANILGLSSSTVQRANNILLKWKLIHKYSGRGHTNNNYILLKPSIYKFQQLVKQNCPYETLSIKDLHKNYLTYMV
jgi:replication initiation and membrane attachment protein DnaB